MLFVHVLYILCAFLIFCNSTFWRFLQYLSILWICLIFCVFYAGFYTQCLIPDESLHKKNEILEDKSRPRYNKKATMNGRPVMTSVPTIAQQLKSKHVEFSIHLLANDVKL